VDHDINLKESPKSFFKLVLLLGACKEFGQSRRHSLNQVEFQTDSVSNEKVTF